MQCQKLRLSLQTRLLKLEHLYDQFQAECSNTINDVEKKKYCLELRKSVQEEQAQLFSIYSSPTLKDEQVCTSLLDLLSVEYETRRFELETLFNKTKKQDSSSFSQCLKSCPSHAALLAFLENQREDLQSCSMSVESCSDLRKKNWELVDRLCKDVQQRRHACSFF